MHEYVLSDINTLIDHLSVFLDHHMNCLKKGKLTGILFGSDILYWNIRHVLYDLFIRYTVKYACMQSLPGNCPCMLNLHPKSIMHKWHKDKCIWSFIWRLKVLSV